MKKKFLFFTIFIGALFSFLLYNELGNRVLQPQIEKFLQSQLENNESIKLIEFNLDFNQLNATLLYNQSTRVKLEGDLSALTQKFDMNYHLISDNFHYKKITIDEHIEINGTLKGHLFNRKLEFEGNAKNLLGEVYFNEGVYQLRDKTLKLNYRTNVDDLSKLQPYIKQKLVGSMKLEGQLNKDKNLTITGTTYDLDGTLDFKLQDKNLQLNMKKLSLIRVMKMLNYPQLFKASIDGELNYSLKNKNGKVNTLLKKAQLLPNNFSELVKEFNGFDLSKERFDESRLTATIEREDISFQFMAENESTKIAILPAHIKRETNQIDAHYRIEIQNRDIGGTIRGDMESPSINIDSSDYLRKEVSNVITEHSETLKNIGIGEREQEKVKSFFDSLFK